ncbi:unnamed protein product [Blepharisma stoltei]|uniref:CCT domain-containing protein n=1 Tax=Blepharisma stoltei TaxID=1481888 RepID=A0AAU9IAB6_9CILI|nr:unnamed protein product [Blepharisma stoltei]
MIECFDEITEIESSLFYPSDKKDFIDSDGSRVIFIDLLSLSSQEEDVPSIEKVPLEFDEESLKEFSRSSYCSDITLNPQIYDILWDYDAGKTKIEQPNSRDTKIIIPRALLTRTVKREIGTLTYRERQEKIKKYIEKRRKRSWNKKIAYDCRKKVADNRLRVKGRFVAKDKASGYLHFENSLFKK